MSILNSPTNTRSTSCTLVMHPNYTAEPFVEFVRSVPRLFSDGAGSVIYKGRNELRMFSIGKTDLVVKSFHKPNVVNSLIYGAFRKSKAQRSYVNALRFLDTGVGTPFPVGYLEIRHGLRFGESFYVSLASQCPYVYNDLFYKEFDYADDVLKAVGRTAAILHEHGYAHKDFGRGNILFMKTDNGIHIDVVDLNRLHIGRIGLREGCKNMERLPATPHFHRLIANEYARIRGYDADECYRLLRLYRSTQPGKINGLY